MKISQSNQTALLAEKPAAPGLAVTSLSGGGDEISSSVEESIRTLQKWVEGHNYAGHEPFDILSSPLLRGRWARWWPLGIAFMQFGKRLAGSRVRRWLRVPESKNPKALGLFISAYCDLARCGDDTESAAAYLKTELKRLRSPNEPEYCWGYDWDHVSRAGRMPPLVRTASQLAFALMLCSTWPMCLETRRLEPWPNPPGGS